MSMRQRNPGIEGTAQPQQPSVLDFKPKSEWKHGEEASFLYVYLPGFAVEQLKITPAYSNRTVKIEGNRRLPDYRLMIVNETFNIPEDYNFSKMEKEFGRGICMLKLPRNIVIPQLDPQQQRPKETKETPKPQETVGGDSMTRKDEEQPNPSKETSTFGFEKQSPDKAAAIDPPVTTTIYEKSAMTVAKSDGEKLVGRKEEKDANGKPTKPESSENVVQNAEVKGEESKAQSKESSVPSAATVAKAKEKEKENRAKSANAKRKEAEKKNIDASAKKGMVKEQNENEDGKLIVNIGTAVLIIIGLVISIVYLRS